MSAPTLSLAGVVFKFIHPTLAATRRADEEPLSLKLRDSDSGHPEMGSRHASFHA
jgi:hypothetical protein